MASDNGAALLISVYIQMGGSEKGVLVKLLTRL
jgi:hypothetical protein